MQTLALSTTYTTIGVSLLLAIGGPIVLTLGGFAVARRHADVGTDPWRLTGRTAEAWVPAWRINLPPDRFEPLSARVARRQAEVDALDVLMYGDRPLPVVSGRQPGAHRAG